MFSRRDDLQASFIPENVRQMLRNVQEDWNFVHVAQQINANSPFHMLATLLFSLYSAVAFNSPSGSRIPTASQPRVSGTWKLFGLRSGKPLHLMATRQSALTHGSVIKGKTMKLRRPNKNNAAIEVTRKIQRASNVADLLEVHQQHAAIFNQIHLSAFWNTMSKLARRESDWQINHASYLESLHQTTTELLPMCETRECSNVAHGMAKAGVHSKGAWVSVWAIVARETAGHMGTFKAQEFSNRIWAFAKAEHDVLDLFHVLTGEAMLLLREFNAQELATTAWAFGKVKPDELQLFSALAREVTMRVHEFNAQDIGLAAWAFARANVKAPGLFEALATEASGRLHQFDHRDLQNVAWAFATVEHTAPELFSLLARETTKRVHEFDPLSLANIAWAFAKAERDEPRLFMSIAKEAMKLMHEFGPQELGNLAWAFSKTRHGGPQFFEALATEASGHLHDFDELSLANLAWAFTVAGHHAPRFHEALACEATRRAHELTPVHIVNIANYFANFEEAPALFEIVEGMSDAGSLQPAPSGGGMAVDVADLFAAFRSQACRRLCNFDLIALKSLQRTLLMSRLLDAGLEKHIFDAVTLFGKEKDEEYPATMHHDEVRPRKDAQLNGPSKLSNEPRLLSEGKIWMAFYKPPFWLVDVDDREAKKRVAAMLADDDDDDGGSAVIKDLQELHDAKNKQKRPKVRHWITEKFGNEYPICSDPLANHGLLHRLDSETSGLLLCAKSHVGRYQLNLQWHADTFEKEYICLVHGWVDPSIREVHKRILKGQKVYEESQKIPSTYCSVSSSGKTAHTELITLAHLVKSRSEGMHDSTELGATATLENEALERRYSLVAVKLHTGRAHQIRVHMLSIGHPPVCDQKYSETAFNADSSWCPRNFLHTYRLGFENIDEYGTSKHDLVSVVCPLPDDLCNALGKLQAVDDRSAKFQADWVSGERDRICKFRTCAEELFGAEASSVN